MDLKDCLKKMDAAGRLAHVHTEVDAVHELSGVAAKLDGGKAVVFEHVKGYDYPVSTGMWWNRENVAAIFDRSVDALPALFAAAVGSLHQNPVAPVVVDDAPAQQVTMPEVDLGRIPVPTHALKDGGPYFSNCIIVAKDPDTGVRNTSIHRLMVTGKDRLGLLMDMGDHHQQRPASGVFRRGDHAELCRPHRCGRACSRVLSAGRAGTAVPQQDGFRRGTCGRADDHGG